MWIARRKGIDEKLRFMEEYTQIQHLHKHEIKISTETWNLRKLSGKIYMSNYNRTTQKMLNSFDIKLALERNMLYSIYN